MPRLRRSLFALCLLFCLHAAHAASALWQLPDLFVDEHGTRGPLAHWAGAQTVVTMEYSACKFVCTTNWRRLLEIQAEADRSGKSLRFLVISLDPAHDSPEQWRDYRKVRGLARDNWSFVTGSRAATDRVVALLGVKWWNFNDVIMHDFRVLRVDAKGEQLALMTRFDVPAAVFLAP